MSQFPPMQPQHPGALRPHRGGPILTLGILGISLFGACGAGFILAIIGLVMSSSELRRMNAGEVDPAGRSFVQAGRVCSIIGVALGVLMLLVWLAYAGVIFAAIAGAASQSGQGGNP